MGLKLGCVGLPNVGKSSLFNTITKNNVPASNYPFCTIEPNKGIAVVPDVRLNILAEMVKTEKVIPAAIEVVDIAGLVKGASQGEGLGNQFLSHIKEVDLILHVVRFFEDSNITHVNNKIEPKEDILTIETELALKDIEVLERSLNSRQLDKKFEPLLKDLIDHMFDKSFSIKDEKEKEFVDRLDLLALKPVIYVFNVSEENASNEVHLEGFSPSITLSVKLENELNSLDDESKKQFLTELGLSEPALDKLVKEAFSTLGLITFFTAGEKEVRAWPISKGTKAPQASGTIHTDFESKFIRLEVVNYKDFVEFGGWEGARLKGKMSVEGKDYEVKDGDIVIVRHGA